MGTSRRGDGPPVLPWLTRDAGDGGGGFQPPPCLPGGTHLVLLNPAFEEHFLKAPASLLAVRAGPVEPLTGSPQRESFYLNAF